MVIDVELDFHVTNKCNLHCLHCIYESNDIPMEDIGVDIVKKIIPDLQKLGVEEVHLTGGEPLLNPSLYEIIKVLKEHGFVVRLQSNGILLTEENTVSKLKKLQIDSVLISIDGLKESHNYLRNDVRSYDCAINAVKLCLSAGIFTRVNTVLYKKNVQDIEGLMIKLSQMGVSQHSFFYLSPGGRGKNIRNLSLSLKEWKEVEMIINENANRLNCTQKVKIQKLLIDMEKADNKCRIASRDNCLIMSNGKVYPCVFFVNSKFCIGNILETQLYELWTNNEYWNQFHQDSGCACNIKNCSGGCIGMSFLLNNRIDICDPRCNKSEGLIPGCIRQYNIGG